MEGFIWIFGETIPKYVSSNFGLVMVAMTFGQFRESLFFPKSKMKYLKLGYFICRISLVCGNDIKSIYAFFHFSSPSKKKLDLKASS